MIGAAIRVAGPQVIVAYDGGSLIALLIITGLFCFARDILSECLKPEDS